MRLNILKVISREFLAKLLTTEGKTSRVDFLVAVAFANLLYAIFSYYTNFYLDLLFQLINAIILYPITLRRLNDVDKTWKTLLWFITIIGIPYVIYILTSRPKNINKEVTSENLDDSSDGDGAVIELRPEYEREKVYLVFSILMIVAVSMLSSFSNSASAKSYYLDYPILKPIIFGNVGVISASIDEMDSDGIIDISILHQPMTLNEKGYLKESLLNNHCLLDYPSNVLFIVHDAKLLISLKEEGAQKSDIMEIKGRMCDLVISNQEDINSQSID